MVDGYDAGDANPIIPPELDDYICDYVDGSMDPSVRAVFEEFLQANPGVQTHVKRVAETAEILRAHGRCLCAPDGFDNRLRCAVESECLRSENWFGSSALSRLSSIVLSGGTIAIVCLGMLVFSYDADQSDATLARTLIIDMFGKNVNASTASLAYSTPMRRVVPAPDRGSLQRAERTPYTPAYMRQTILEDSPVTTFNNVQASPVLVLYP